MLLSKKNSSKFNHVQNLQVGLALELIENQFLNYLGDQISLNALF
jgi:hypothetical protein